MKVMTSWSSSGPNCLVVAEDCALEYMAPEIIHGEPYDEKIDIYAFGLVLLSLITREDPHQGTTFLQTLSELQ